MPILSYTDHPGSVHEHYRELHLEAVGTDYAFTIAAGDGRALTFRYCISGGFEHKCPKTTMAVAELFRAMQEECP